MSRKRNVSWAVLALVARAEQGRMRQRVFEVGWPTPEEDKLYAEQRRLELPADHPYV